MLNVHFTRHGFADWIEIRETKFYVSYHHMTGSLEICVNGIRHVVLRNAFGEIKHEYDQDITTTVYHGKTKYSGPEPVNAFEEIEELIHEHTGRTVKIEPFVEAYYVAAGAHRLYDYTAADVPMYHGIDVRGLTVAEVLQRGLTWEMYFADYKCLTKIFDLLDMPAVLNMPFVDFYTLVHDNGYKQDFRERVKDELCKAVLV